jgi:hypothetical protein
MMTEMASLSQGRPPRRTYILSIGKDLFGMPFVQREFGYTCGGNRTVKVVTLTTEEDVQATARRLIKAAKRRGYEE